MKPITCFKEDSTMKKCFAIISLALAAMVSCNKIDELPEEEGSVSPAAEVPEGKVLVSFKADMAVPTPEGDTKTTLETNGTVLWEAGDEIEVWYLAADNTPKHFTAFATSAGPSSDFTGTMDEGDAPTEFWAAYPKDAGELKYEDSAGKFYITVGRADGTFKAANIMAGYSTAAAASFAFKNAVGIVKLALPSNGFIQHNGLDYPITAIRLKGKETSIRSMGTVLVSQSGGSVSEFAAAGGTQSAAVDIDDVVRASGVVYIPSFPGELTNGFAVRYYSDAGNIPAVLTKDTPVTITRGNIKPLSDLTPRIVWDYYVSATGSGDGLTAATPMSIADFEEFIGCNATSNVIICYSNRLNGATFHFTEGTHSISEAITLPAQSIYSEAAYYTITGDDAATLDGGGTSRIFEIDNACDRTTISYLTLTNGASDQNGGLVIINNSAAVFDNCNFTNTTTSGNGGVAYIATANTGKGTFTNCTFSGNTAANGGAICITNPNTTNTMENCTFTNNHATNNGGAYYAANGTSTLTRCVLGGANGKGNTAVSYGGAFNASTSAAGSKLIMEGGEISYNSAAGAGALYSTLSNSIDMTGVTIKNNSATGGVGGAFLFDKNSPKINLRGCVFSDNSCTGTNGGGAINISDKVTAPVLYIDKCLFKDNTVAPQAATNNSGHGYDIRINKEAAILGMHNCTIYNQYLGVGKDANNKTFYPNASSVQSIGITTIVNSTFSGTGNSGRGCFQIGYKGVADGDESKSILCNNVMTHSTQPSIWSKAGTDTYSLLFDYCVVKSATLRTASPTHIVQGEHNAIGAFTMGEYVPALLGYFNAPTLPAGYSAPTKVQIETILAPNPMWEAFVTWLGDEWGKDQAGNSRGTDDNSVWTPGSIQ